MLFKSHPITVRTFTQPYPFEIYTPEGPGPFPVIFQTPILGRFALLEDLFFERRFARFFASQGLICVLIDRPIFEFDSGRGLEQIPGHIEESMKRNQAVFECVLTEKTFDTQRMGTFGMSLGAIVNLLWAAREKRLNAHVFCTPGGNLPHIFMASLDPLMMSYRKAALNTCGGSKKKLLKSLLEIFTLDPLTAAAAIPPEQCLMVLGLFDLVVPYKYGKELRKKLGNPAAILLPLGHYFSILAAPIVKWLVVRFFKQKWFQASSPKKI